MADDLLCAGRLAPDIINALMDVYPNNEWFVLTQALGSWSGHVGYTSNYCTHVASNLCEKNLVVWMYSWSSQGCNTNADGMEWNLINAASSSGSTPDVIANYILNHEASYSLTHYFTISWTTGSSVANYVVQSCVFVNSKAWYLIRSEAQEKEDGLVSKEASTDIGGSI